MQKGRTNNRNQNSNGQGQGAGPKRYNNNATSGNGGSQYSGGAQQRQQKPRYNEHHYGAENSSDQQQYSSSGPSRGKENYSKNGGGYQNCDNNPEYNNSYRQSKPQFGGRPQTTKQPYNGGYEERQQMPAKNANYQPQQQRPQGNTASSNPFAGMKAPGFAPRPQASAAAGPQYTKQQAPPRTANNYGGAQRGGPRTQAAAPSSKQSQVSLLSNQYRLTLGQNACVYQYVLDIKPDEYWESHRVHDIIRTKKTSLEKALGAYVVSGKTIYTLTELEDTLVFKTSFRGEQAQIMIDKDSGCQIHLTDSFSNKDNDISQNLINVILKQAFRETNLKQLGRSPRFFDVNKPINLDKIGLRMWSGFKASAFQSELGCTLAVDNIFKFMSTTTCLQRIRQMRADAHSDHQWQQLVRMEFSGKSIIADWGNKRTYRVEDVDFEQTPVVHEFIYNDVPTKLAQYFAQVHGKNVSDVNQPCFLVKMGDQQAYLPSEFCLLDGVPDSIRKGAGMRDALAMTRVTPKQKIREIQQMVDLLAQQNSMKNWGLQVEEVPISLDSFVLGAPQMQLLTNGQIIQCSEQALKRLPIQKAVDLLQDEWIMIYQHPEQAGPRKRSNFDIADNIYNTFRQASGMLKIKVEEPYFIELEQENDYREVKNKLLEYMMAGPNSVFRHPKVVLVVLGYENNYSMYKELFQEFKIPSQVVTTRNGRSFNMSKASNILRQINSKIEGDLFHLKFPEVMQEMRTMLIGIDVCHAGPSSVVGFAASTNKEMSQYYSEYIVQRKGQEIVETRMKESLKKAIEVFAESHNRNYPTHYIIYRDGVGDAMRDQVIQKELTQFREAFAEVYNKVGATPKVTLVVVNKRITQRFFVKNERGELMNPPSGCIVDRGLVENSQATPGSAFDFFMMPSGANQGCVLPTHFHVPINESKLKKIELEQLTYALCHFYFNWAGPIKVPAPCQYAHKIAEFYMTIGAAKKGHGNRNNNCKGGVSEQQESFVKQQCVSVKPLNHKLHYL